MGSEQNYYKNLSSDLLRVEDDLMILKKDMEDACKTIDTSGNMSISRSKWEMEDKFKSGVKQITYGVTRLTNSVDAFLNLLVNEGIISPEYRQQGESYEANRGPGQKRKRHDGYASVEDATTIISEFLEECREEADNKQEGANAGAVPQQPIQSTSWYQVSDPHTQSPRPRSPQYPPQPPPLDQQQQPMQYIQNIQAIPTLPLNGQQQQQQAVQAGWSAPPSKQAPLEQKKAGKKTKKNR